MTEVIEQPPLVKTGDPQEDLFTEVAAKLDAKRAVEEKPPVVNEPVNTETTTVVVDKPIETENVDTPVADDKKDTTPAPAKSIEVSDEELMKTLGLDAKNPEDPTNVVSQNEDVEIYKTKLAKLEAVASDEVIQYLIDAKANGKSTREALKEIQGEDYSKLSAKELFELDLNTHELSDEDKQNEREKFNGMLISQQKELGNKIKQGLEAKNSNLLEQHKGANLELIKLRESNRQKAHVKVNELRELKHYKNLELTPERWAKIDERLETLMPNEKQEYEVEKAFRYAIFDLFENDLLMATARKATTKGKVEVLDDVNRSSKGTSTPHTAPPVTEGATAQKKDIDAFLEEQKEPFKN